MLKIENFSKSYDGGNTYAVKDLNLQVNAGEIVAFIGHNGSGKSTTLKSIAGVLEIDEGKIEVDGIDVKTKSLQAKKIISYVPETVEVYEHLKGIDYLNFIADVFEINEQNRKQSIEKYLKLFNIYGALNDPIATYSHGMKQKIALTAALLHTPKLMLLDEPFFGLDPQSSYDFKQILKDLTKQGVCVFYSTHVLEAAEKLATSVIIISKGKVVKQGKLSTILERVGFHKIKN